MSESLFFTGDRGLQVSAEPHGDDYLDDETCDRCGDTCCGYYHDKACAERGECPECLEQLADCDCPNLCDEAEGGVE